MGMNMTKTYRIADVNIMVTAIHSAVLSFCSGYETDGDAVFSVSISQQNITFERSRADHPGYPFCWAYRLIHAVFFKQKVFMYQLKAVLTWKE